MSGVWVKLSDDSAQAARHMMALFDYAERGLFGHRVFYMGKQLQDYQDSELYRLVWDSYAKPIPKDVMQASVHGEMTVRVYATIEHFNKARHVNVWDDEDAALVKLLKPAS